MTPQTESTDELIARFKATGEPALREALLLRHLGLVSRIARRFTSRGTDLEDLVQVGFVGLMKALDRYDAAFGVPFGAFAFPTVVGEIQRYFRDRADLIRSPRRVSKLRARRRLVAERLAQELGRLPTQADIQAAMPDVPDRDLDEAAAAPHRVTLAESNADVPGDGEAQGVWTAREDERLERVEDRTAVRQVLARLSPRERILLHLRFYEGLSQTETARRLGISQMHVSRLEHRAIDRMRRVIDQ